MKAPVFSECAFSNATCTATPGYTVDLPNRESPACLAAFGEEGVELSPTVDWASTVASWRAKLTKNSSASTSSSTSGIGALGECEVLNKIVVGLYKWNTV